WLGLGVLSGNQGAGSAVGNLFGGVLADAHEIGTTLLIAVGFSHPQAAFGVPDEGEAAAAVLRGAGGRVDVTNPDVGVGPDLGGGIGLAFLGAVVTGSGDEDLGDAVVGEGLGNGLGIDGHFNAAA